MLALLAPGQGSQAPGMLTPWLDLPGAQARLRWFSALTGLDLIRLGTEADAEEIKDTAVTQPLIVALGLLAAGELPIRDVGVTAGHSVGELTAAAIAGVLPAETAIALAGLRGAKMAAACAEAETGMAAVLGGADQADVLAAIEAAGLTPANVNGAGQVVAAGSTEALAKLADNPPERAKVRALQVAGAFHTSYMASAEAALAEVEGGIDAADPRVMLLSNADGAAVDSGAEVIRRLVKQVTSPVRWDLCQATLRDLGVTAIIELPPAGTLSGLAKRELKGIQILTVKTPDDLAAAAELIATEAGGDHQAQHTPDWRMVIAPVGGTIRRSGAAEGAPVEAGAPLTVIAGRKDEHQVLASYAGTLVEWLVEDGDLVDPGDPLARLEPVGV